MKKKPSINPVLVPISVALFLTLGLVAIKFLLDEDWFEKWFSLLTVVGGLVVGTFALYGAWQSKRLAEAKFIRELNDSFTSNPNIDFIWEKIINEREITQADRHRLSAYLTFFETIYLLHQRNTLNIVVIDHLFRNRFFKAIGNRWVQETALIKHYDSFSNIHELAEVWHDHLCAKNINHAGFDSYLQAVNKRLDESSVRPSSEASGAFEQDSGRVRPTKPTSGKHGKDGTRRKKKQ